MKASGKTMTLAPVAAASPIRPIALSTQASASKGTAGACTTATRTVVCFAGEVMAQPSRRVFLSPGVRRDAASQECSSRSVARPRVCGAPEERTTRTSSKAGPHSGHVEPGVAAQGMAVEYSKAQKYVQAL